MVELSQRKKDILTIIVETYTENENLDPIGSSELLKKLGVNVSTATLRNEMAELEELGYLEKTHTSSGRIPTAKGYRLYFDELLVLDDLQGITEFVRSKMEQTKLPKAQACRKVLEELLNKEELNYSALLLEKTAYNSSIAKIVFVPTNNNQGVFILVTNRGQIYHNETYISKNLNIADIERTVAFFDENFHGLLLNDFKNARKIEINNFDFFNYISNSEDIVKFVIINLNKLLADKKEIICPYNILKHSDFSDIRFAQSYLNEINNNNIFQLINFDGEPLPVIGSSNQVNISVKVASEHNTHNISEENISLFKNFSSITAYYSTKEGTGAITVYGPVRMKYKSVIAILSAIVCNLK